MRSRHNTRLSSSSSTSLHPRDFDMDRTSPADSSSSKENNEDAVRAAVHRLHQQIKKATSNPLPPTSPASCSPSTSASTHTARAGAVPPKAYPPRHSSTASASTSWSSSSPSSQRPAEAAMQLSSPHRSSVTGSSRASTSTSAITTSSSQSEALTPIGSQQKPLPSPALTMPTPEPSLYAAVFGPQVASKLNETIAASIPKTPPRQHTASFAYSTPRHSKASPTPSSSGSPYGINGTPRGFGLSARLHAISSLPQLGSPERAKRGGPPAGMDPHNSPSKAHLQREELLAHAHPRQSWVVIRGDARATSPTLDTRNAFANGSKRKRGEEEEVLSSPAHAGHLPRTPSRHGRLSNGHPATPLAKDLGIMSGSRSRQASHSATPHRVRFSSPLQEPATNEETDRVAGVLFAISERNKREQAAAHSQASHSGSGPAFSPTLATATPVRKQEGQFAVPSSITPRRARVAGQTTTPLRRASTPTNPDEGDNSSANLLLFLAGSPNAPQTNSRRTDGEASRMPGSEPVGSSGATPSLLSSVGRRRSFNSGRRELFDDDEDGTDYRKRNAAGREMSGSPTPSRGVDLTMLGPSPIITPPTRKRTKMLGRTEEKSSAGGGGSRPGSDSPITPPHSNRLKSAKLPGTESGSGPLEAGSTSSSQPAETPPYTPFHPQRNPDGSFSPSSSPSASATSLAATVPKSPGPQPRGRLLSGQPLPPPRTPSPGLSETTPRTPRTPNQPAVGGAGSFAFSEFVNVSPSPKPRTRLMSEKGVFPGRTPSLERDAGGHATKTRARIRGRSRGGDELDGHHHHHAPEMLLTPGPLDIQAGGWDFPASMPSHSVKNARKRLSSAISITPRSPAAKREDKGSTGRKDTIEDTSMGTAGLGFEI